MIKYFCDRCEKDIDSLSELFEVTVEPPELRKWTDDAETGTYILCYDCVRELNKCLERKESEYDRDD